MDAQEMKWSVERGGPKEGVSLSFYFAQAVKVSLEQNGSMWNWSFK